MGFIMKRIKAYFFGRLREVSTWKAIVSFIVTMAGYKLSNGQLELAGSAGAAVYAFLSAVLPDKLGGSPLTTQPGPQSIPEPTGPAPVSQTTAATPVQESRPGSPSGGPFGTS